MVPSPLHMENIMRLSHRELYLAHLVIGGRAHEIRLKLAEGKSSNPIIDARYAQELEELALKFEHSHSVSVDYELGGGPLRRRTDR